MIEKLVEKTTELLAIQHDGTEERLLAIAAFFGTIEPGRLKEGDFAVGEPGRKVKIIKGEKMALSFLKLENPVILWEDKKHKTDE